MSHEIILLRKKSKIHWRVINGFATLNYTEYFLVQTSVVIGCISIYASLLGISISITSSAIGLKNCAITERIK